MSIGLIALVGAIAIGGALGVVAACEAVDRVTAAQRRVDNDGCPSE